TSGGRSETDMKELTVTPDTVGRRPAVSTVTPVGRRAMDNRYAAAETGAGGCGNGCIVCGRTYNTRVNRMSATADRRLALSWKATYSRSTTCGRHFTLNASWRRAGYNGSPWRASAPINRLMVGEWDAGCAAPFRPTNGGRARGNHGGPPALEGST